MIFSHFVEQCHSRVAVYVVMTKCENTDPSPTERLEVDLVGIHEKGIQLRDARLEAHD